MDFLSNLWGGIKSIGSSIGSALSPNMTIAPKSGLADVSSLLGNAQSALSSSLSGTQTKLGSITTPYQSIAPKNTTPTVRNITPTVIPYVQGYNPNQSVAPQNQFAGSITTPYQSIAPTGTTISQPTQPFIGGSSLIQTPTSLRGGEGLVTKEIQSYATRGLNPSASSGSSSANIGNQSGS